MEVQMKGKEVLDNSHLKLVSSSEDATGSTAGVFTAGATNMAVSADEAGVNIVTISGGNVSGAPNDQPVMGRKVSHEAADKLDLDMSKTTEELRVEFEGDAFWEMRAKFVSLMLDNCLTQEQVSEIFQKGFELLKGNINWSDESDAGRMLSYRMLLCLGGCKEHDLRGDALMVREQVLREVCMAIKMNIDCVKKCINEGDRTGDSYQENLHAFNTALMYFMDCLGDSLWQMDAEMKTWLAQCSLWSLEQYAAELFIPYGEWVRMYEYFVIAGVPYGENHLKAMQCLKEILKKAGSDSGAMVIREMFEIVSLWNSHEELRIMQWSDVTLGSMCGMDLNAALEMEEADLSQTEIRRLEELLRTVVQYSAIVVPAQEKEMAESQKMEMKDVLIAVWGMVRWRGCDVDNLAEIYSDILRCEALINENRPWVSQLNAVLEKYKQWTPEAAPTLVMEVVNLIVQYPSDSNLICYAVVKRIDENNKRSVLDALLAYVQPAERSDTQVYFGLLFLEYFKNYILNFLKDKELGRDLVAMLKTVIGKLDPLSAPVDYESQYIEGTVEPRHIQYILGQLLTSFGVTELLNEND